MAYIVMAYIVPYSNGSHSYGLHSYGLSGYGLNSYGTGAGKAHSNSDLFLAKSRQNRHFTRVYGLDRVGGKDRKGLWRDASLGRLRTAQRCIFLATFRGMPTANAEG